MLSLASDPQTRRAALDAAWQSLQDRTSAPRSAFDEATAGATVHAVEIDGRISGALVVIGAELHACVKPGAFGRWLHRPALRVLRDVVDAYGRATTSVQAHCGAGVQFVQRLGFREVGRDGGVIRYELREVPHGV